MIELCKECKRFLLDYEIDYCRDNLCSDCCEESHNVDEILCDKEDCPNTVCNSRKQMKKLFEQWYDDNEESLQIECAETGADRELDFDFDTFAEYRYEAYLNKKEKENEN